MSSIGMMMFWLCGVHALSTDHQLLNLTVVCPNSKKIVLNEEDLYQLKDLTNFVLSIKAFFIMVSQTKAD